MANHCCLLFYEFSNGNRLVLSSGARKWIIAELKEQGLQQGMEVVFEEELEENVDETEGEAVDISELQSIDSESKSRSSFSSFSYTSTSSSSDTCSSTTSSSSSGASSKSSSSGSSDSESSSSSSSRSSSSRSKRDEAPPPVPITDIPGGDSPSAKEPKKLPYACIYEDFEQIEDFLAPRGAFLPNIKTIAERSRSKLQGYTFSALARLDPNAEISAPTLATDLFERVSTIGEIRLLRDEVPLQVEWLNLPFDPNMSWLDGKILREDGLSEEKDENKSNLPFKYIAAIITTLRILIVSSSLSVLNEVHRNSHPSFTFSPLSYYSNSVPFFTSCMWVGLTL
jgi:hypothetical protein